MSNIIDQSNVDGAFYKTLLESTNAIPWRIDWKTFKFSYIGPQIEKLLGWEPESWVSAEDWAARMHPEDRSWVVDFCIAQSKSGVDHEADYRAITKDGSYVWIRDVVHVLRDENGEVESLVGFMFDITERKENEQKLLNLQKELEDYSFKDSLTNVANRRMFDTVLSREWSHAQRQRQIISIILFDIDYFKEYNDFYGHLKGDECLKQVAQTLSNVIKRPRDFLARFGGEEFVLILPDTDQIAAAAIAAHCRNMINQEQIPHEMSKIGKWLTISMGVATIAPTKEDDAITFIGQVDKLLYQAKQNGRNCIVKHAY